MLTVLDLFSGIGGFSLGLERTGGFKTVAFCEIDPFCRKVLAKHWPDVPIHQDVTKLRGEDVGPVDVIAGGFPCQDTSVCGKRSGLEGEHSGLWTEFARLVREIRPLFVIVENTPGLLVHGMGDVVGDLADVGYDVEWHGIPAAAIGAPHYRARHWMVAYPVGFRDGPPPNPILTGRRISGICPWWSSEPGVDRVAYELPNRVDRLRSLGNAVVPQVVEVIGNAILDAA